MVQLQNDLQALQPFGQYRKRAMGTFWDVNNKVELNIVVEEDEPSAEEDSVAGPPWFPSFFVACRCLSLPFPPPQTPRAITYPHPLTHNQHAHSLSFLSAFCLSVFLSFFLCFSLVLSFSSLSFFLLSFYL